MTTASSNSYLRWWAFATFGIALTAAFFNLLVDPYGLYHVLEVDGINAFKSRAAQRGRQFKMHLLERYRPAAVVLGNSRAEVGFDPTHPAFARARGPTLNLALPGTDIDTSVEFMRRAIGAGPPRIAVIGLDFVDARITGDAAPRAPLIRNEDRVHTWWDRSTDGINTIMSIDALQDSVRTLFDNRRADSPGLTSLGFNPSRDYIAIARREGYHQLFLQRDLENAKNYARGPKAVFLKGTRNSPYFDAVRALMASCRLAGIELHLVVYPYHAHILELLHEMSLWDSFEEWKRTLTAILREERSTGSPALSVRLWDFSGYSDYATERVPAAADRRTRMQWYWEAGHFKKELGDIMLERILASAGAAKGSADAFGVVLEDGMLEQHLSRIRADRQHYRQSHPEEMRELEILARNVMQTVPSAKAKRGAADVSQETSIP